MSLMGTLAKVAIGYAAARGVDRLSDGKGLAGLLGGGAKVESDNPLAQMQGQLAQMMGGASSPLSGLMEQMKGGGFDLSSLLGGGGAGGSAESQGSALAGLLAAAGGMAAAGGKTMGGALDQVAQAAPQAEETAALMLRAMIQAAKSDGGIDEAERKKLLDALGDDADADDIAFVQEQLAAPVDPQALADDTPAPQRAQVYAASLMTIRVDTQAEAQYLDQLARAMGLDHATVNTLHMQQGLQPLYG